MTSCSLFSPAKINLSLRILGKRPDGYHELLTEMVMISLGDTMVFRLSDEPRDLLAVSGRPVDGNPDDNLVLRAIRLFREMRGFGGKPSYWKVELEKKIPVGAGLGGGSSNAAAALWAMNLLSGNSCSRQDLMEIGAKLGSDVPFFWGKRMPLPPEEEKKFTPAILFPEKHLFCGTLLFLSQHQGFMVGSPCPGSIR